MYCNYLRDWCELNVSISSVLIYLFIFKIIYRENIILDLEDELYEIFEELDGGARAGGRTVWKGQTVAVYGAESYASSVGRSRLQYSAEPAGASARCQNGPNQHEKECRSEHDARWPADFGSQAFDCQASYADGQRLRRAYFVWASKVQAYGSSKWVDDECREIVGSILVK